VTPAVATEIDRYLRTGDTDVYHRAWRGESFMARARQAHEDLRGALVAEVERRSRGVAVPGVPTPEETVALTRRKTEPMIRGLFPRIEQDTVLALVERSVIFLTPANIGAVLSEESWDGSAWDIANLYLGSIGADLLGPDAPRIVGISEEATCYVSPRYFDKDDGFADFVVHEVAHIFHNCKRQTVGLPYTRRREWLLDIAFRERETFAYCCEAYARILERARRPAERIAEAEAFAARYRSCDERVDAAEVADIVLEAAGRRNGWKVILGRCAPDKKRRSRARA